MYMYYYQTIKVAYHIPFAQKNRGGTPYPPPMDRGGQNSPCWVGLSPFSYFFYSPFIYGNSPTIPENSPKSGRKKNYVRERTRPTIFELWSWNLVWINKKNRKMVIREIFSKFESAFELSTFEFFGHIRKKRTFSCAILGQKESKFEKNNFTLIFENRLNFSKKIIWRAKKGSETPFLAHTRENSPKITKNDYFWP